MTNPVWAGVTIDFELLKDYGWYVGKETVDGTEYPRLVGYNAAALSEMASKLTQADVIAAASAGAVPCIRYAWNTATSDVDPGSGKIAGNNSSISSITQFFVSTSDTSGASVSGILGTYDDSTSTIKGMLGIAHRSDTTKWATFSMTALTSATGFVKLTVAYLGGSGTLANTDPVAIGFIRTGDKGDAGNAGTPASETVAGVVELATPGEVSAGTDTQRAVVPFTLAGKLTEAAILQGKHVLAVLGGTPETTNGAAYSSLDLSGNKQKFGVYSFDAATVEYLDFLVPMPSSWDEGTLTFKVYWRHVVTTTNFGVVWSLQAVAVGDGDTLDASMGTAVTVADTGGDATKLYISAESGAMTVAGTPQAGDLVMFRLSRAVADGSDTMAIDADFICASVFMTITSAVEA